MKGEGILSGLVLYLSNAWASSSGVAFVKKSFARYLNIKSRNMVQSNSPILVFTISMEELVLSKSNLVAWMKGSVPIKAALFLRKFRLCIARDFACHRLS